MDDYTTILAAIDRIWPELPALLGDAWPDFAVRIAEHRRRGDADPAQQPLGHDLTERERDVLALMVKGKNNSEIADKLVVSRSTIKYHVSNILSKLQATSRTEAVAYALQQNLYNFFRRMGINKQVATVVTQVEVDRNDPAFKNPT